MLKVAPVLGPLLVLIAPTVVGAQEVDAPRPEDTEIWSPAPPIVAPASPDEPVAPPSDAIVLFDGTSLAQWVNSRDGTPASWVVADGVFSVDNDVGDIETAQSFLDFQLHLEWRVPAGVMGTGQARGNSGLFLATAGSGYEVQILDAYQNETYVNGMAGSVYKQSIPLANPARPPGEWQHYDVIWRAPRFDGDGSLLRPARVTVFFNGVVVQDSFELEGQTRWIGPPDYDEAHGATPIRLQAHGDPGPTVSFRNIWLRELTAEAGE